jgi:hypothetical protein
MLQDVGATFGPVKVNLRSWRDTPVWADDTGCRVTMRDLPYHGGTFPHDVHISEGGRRLLAARLAALQPSDITALFTASRFPEPISSWAGAFQSKVEQIASRTCDTGT